MIIIKHNGISVSKDAAAKVAKLHTIAKVSRPLTYEVSTTTKTDPFTKEVITKEHKVYVDDITDEEIGDGVRVLRDLKFAETNFAVERHREELELGVPTTLTPAEYQAVLQYRQELRDLPLQEGFPHEYQWPEVPVEV